MLQTVIFNDPESLKKLGFENRDEINTILNLIYSINKAISQSNNRVAFAELKECVNILPSKLLKLFNNCLELNTNKQLLIEWIRTIPEPKIDGVFNVTMEFQYHNFIAFIFTTKGIELDVNYKDEGGQGIIQALFEKKTFYTNDYLSYFLQRGYQIDRKDRESMRDRCEKEVYKMYATLSRLALNLYKQDRTDLIPELFHSVDRFVKLIYIIESFVSNNSAYFAYKTNVWLCIANNAITNYKDYWIFIEAALKKSGRWEELYKENSFRIRYDAIDKNEVLKWKSQKEYEILCSIYPQLEVPAIHIEKKEEVVSSYEYVDLLFEESELTDVLKKLSVFIEKQLPVWGYKHIEGQTAEEKVYSLWNTLSHEAFFDALFYLSNVKASYIILYQLKKFVEIDLRDVLYNSEVYLKLQRGLETGRISNLHFRLLLWELGYRYDNIQSWQKRGCKTSIQQMELYCLDRLCNNDSIGDMKEIMGNDVIRTFCLIEAIKNNHLFFTEKSWKSYINSTRGAGLNHPLNKYWGYIDIAFDGCHLGNGKSMREYLLQKEPGIRLEKSTETIDVKSDLYTSLSILYPEIYKHFQ